MKNNTSTTKESLSLRTSGEWNVKLTTNKLDGVTYRSWDIQVEQKDGFVFIAEIGGEKNLEAKANAEYICKAVNHFDSLVAALQEVNTWFFEGVPPPDFGTPKRALYDKVQDTLTKLNSHS